MKKRSVVSAMGILAAAASSASAQLVYEPMDYSTATRATGTNLANLTGAPTFAGYQNPRNGLNWFDTGTAVAGSGAEQTLSNNNLTPTAAGVTLAPSYGDALSITAAAPRVLTPSRIETLASALGRPSPADRCITRLSCA